MKPPCPTSTGSSAAAWILTNKSKPPIKFKQVFARAREEGYRLTMHCDVDQEGSTTHIWQTLNDIGVERIDHSVNSLEDETLCAEIIKRGLVLTVCPISNGYATDGLKAADLDEAQVVQLAVNAFDAVLLPADQRKEYRRKADGYAAR